MHVDHEDAGNTNSCISGHTQIGVDFQVPSLHLRLLGVPTSNSNLNLTDCDQVHVLYHIQALHFTMALKASRHTFLFISSKHCPSSVIYTPTSGAP